MTPRHRRRLETLPAELAAADDAKLISTLDALAAISRGQRLELDREMARPVQDLGKITALRRDLVFAIRCIDLALDEIERRQGRPARATLH